MSKYHAVSFKKIHGGHRNGYYEMAVPGGQSVSMIIQSHPLIYFCHIEAFPHGIGQAVECGFQVADAAHLVFGDKSFSRVALGIVQGISEQAGIPPEFVDN